ncbi:hypothetical protein ACMBCN_03195 [Candidatus Liberibacter asiaticus]
MPLFKINVYKIINLPFNKLTIQYFKYIILFIIIIILFYLLFIFFFSYKSHILG